MYLWKIIVKSYLIIKEKYPDKISDSIFLVKLNNMF